MNKSVDKYLLIKYAIPKMSRYCKPGSRLCEILYRLNKNKKLDNIDKQWIWDKHMISSMFSLYHYVKDLEEGKDTKKSLYNLHDANNFPYKDFIASSEVGYFEIKNYLFDKYAILETEFKEWEFEEFYEKIYELYKILLRLEKNDILDDTDKSWIQNNGMSKLYAFFEKWEISGKPDFDSLYNPVTDVDNIRNINKCEQNPIKPKNKQVINYSLIMKIRKQNMHSHYNKVTLTQNIRSNFSGLTPSKIPEDISSLILDKIWNTMHDSIQKDVKELFMVYACQQWTATSLMAMRLLENALNIHLEYDLNEKSVRSMGDAIKKLEEHEYNSNLLAILREYKDERNNLMHGKNRAGASDTKRLVVNIMIIVMSIYNIRS